MTLVATSTVPSEFQYQSWQTFQSQLITWLPGINGSPGHQWVQVYEPGQFPPVYDGPSAAAVPIPNSPTPAPVSATDAANPAISLFMLSRVRHPIATDPNNLRIACAVPGRRTSGVLEPSCSPCQEPLQWPL